MDPTNQIQKALDLAFVRYIERKEEGWLAFMRDELKYTPDAPMIPIVTSIANFKDTAVRSSHGVGKTALGSALLCTAMALVPEVLVLQMSPTWSQVKGVFWNELRKWYGNSRMMQTVFEIAEKTPTMLCRLSPHTWYAQGIASNAPGRIEGRHAKRVLLIGDEMKAIEDPLIEGIQGALTSERSWRLYLSTPSTPGGRFTSFYYCFTKNRQHWKTFKITADESPRVSRSWVDRMIREYGADSQIVKARVFADFPDVAGDTLIPLQVAELFYQEGFEAEGKASIGVDVARFGSDESVASVWRGETLIALNVIKISSEKQRLTDLAREVQRMVNEYGASVVIVDDIGVGGGITDVLSEVYDNSIFTQVVPFTANNKANQEAKFKSLGDEVLWEFSEAIKSGAAKSVVDDERLVYQLSSYRKAYTVDERMIIKWPEKKGDRSADEKSPDRGDAAWLGWYGARLLKSASTSTDTTTKEEDADVETGALEFAGIREKLF